MANTISTSTNATATGYTPAQLVALSASGDVLVVWFDGTNVKWSYAASSNYGSWTTATLISSLGGGPRWQAGIYKLSNDNVLLVTSNASANTVSYLFTYSSSGHSWSVGSAVSVVTGQVHSNGGSCAMDMDAQGRIWAAWANNSHVVQVYYTANNGTSWTASTTITEISGGDDTSIGLASIGNYIVAVVCMTGPAWKYQRIDAHSATLGSWGAATAISSTAMDNGAYISLRGAPGSNYGVWVGNEYSAIPAQYYNASTDTWSSVTNIGASSNDQMPILVSDGTNLYCLWCKYSAASNYSLVYKKWTASTQTWDSASTQLEASGTNIQWPNGGYGNSTLGFVYLVGTASPYSVEFDTASFASGVSLTATLAGAGTLSGTLTASVALTETLAGSGTLTATLSASVSLADTLSGVGQLSGTLSASTSLACSMAGSGTLAATLTVTAPLAVSMAGAGQLSGELSLSTALATTIDGVGQLAGTLSAATNLEVTCAGVGTLTAQLSFTTALAAALSGIGALSGALTLAASLSVLFAASGTLRAALSLSGTNVLGIALIGDSAYGSAGVSDVLIAAALASDQEYGDVSLSDQG